MKLYFPGFLIPHLLFNSSRPENVYSQSHRLFSNQPFPKMLPAGTPSGDCSPIHSFRDIFQWNDGIVPVRPKNGSGTVRLAALWITLLILLTLKQTWLHTNELAFFLFLLFQKGVFDFQNLSWTYNLKEKIQVAYIWDQLRIYSHQTKVKNVKKKQNRSKNKWQIFASIRSEWALTHYNPTRGFI